MITSKNNAKITKRGPITTCPQPKGGLPECVRATIPYLDLPADTMSRCIKYVMY